MRPIYTNCSCVCDRQFIMNHDVSIWIFILVINMKTKITSVTIDNIKLKNYQIDNKMDSREWVILVKKN